MLRMLRGFALAGLAAVSLAGFSGGAAKAQGFAIEFGSPAPWVALGPPLLAVPSLWLLWRRLWTVPGCRPAACKPTG